ncbi:NAD synthase [Candidatus Rickettsiella viridis]|uniref:Glutamine-dependent NAD(+) synthetase n=1 Tax=Candidatus Rickettsiella viridis TaxID=676208 RepID=A0A2Z5UXB4_9COXI|nr:NAD synthase [Candidatus Rickettsiella viridis]
MLKIAIGQFNFLVGSIEANTQKILDVIKEAKQAKADLLVFPELALCGYPPEDLLLREDFKQQIKNALKIIQAQANGISILLGHPDYTEQGIYNAASLMANKKIVTTYHKQCLPNYGVFDERRYFKPGNSLGLIKIKDISIGILICEDLWHPGPILSAKHAGAELIICINASPFDETKAQERISALQINIAQTNLPVLYVHGVSGQDDLVFDGGSLAFDSQGTLTAHAGFFTEKLWLVDFKPTEHAFISQALPADQSVEALIYQALVLAVRDYVDKNHFPGVLLGLSGGIDSALVLAIAVDALGKDRVHAVTLPSRFTSELSLQIASKLAETLAVQLTTLSIEASFCAFLTTLNLDPQQPPAGITTENIQARCRAVLLMALSNQSGDLLLNASNKSELAVGYATLYGDMAGGFAVIKDVPKMMVYKLAHYRNSITPVFPKELLARAPSAELASDQRDEDSLPPYSELDPILALYVEQDKSVADIVAAGFKKEMVERIIKLVDRSEYKRRQIAVGPRTTTRAFGRERRYPISSGFFPD